VGAEHLRPTADAEQKDRDTGAVELVRSQIEATGGQVSSFIADLTRYREIEAMREQIEHVHGPVDILVANAGGSPSRPAPLEQISEAAGAQPSTPT
jgi:3-oxoacyl-[acyl-carrier protein] reductase